MTLAGLLDTLGAGRQAVRRVAWSGALFIAAIVAIATFDIIRGHRAGVDDTGRELETQARIIAEQTARSVHAVDIVLRHIADEFRRGRLAQLSAQELHAYLREQAVGLVQVDGFALHDARGDALAISWLAPQAMVNVMATPAFVALRDGPRNGLQVNTAQRSVADQQWVLPLGRRLDTAAGEFAGVIVARGRIDYFQQFYRDVQLEPGTKVTLMHTNGTLLARHPPAAASLGQHIDLFDTLRAAQAAGGGLERPLRIISPIDGVARFAAVRTVPEYPLAVVVTRDVSLALAPWRTQALGTAALTLALGLLAALLLALVLGQLRRLLAARESLAAQQERFALAVAGSDDGVWDWDYKAGLAFESARARELQALPPGPELQPIDVLVASLRVHPEDMPRRAEGIRAHLAGETPAYECEYRVRHDDGRYRWVRIRAMCTRDAQGQPIRMAGSVSDIDARKRAEEALRESEAQKALAVAGSNDGILYWDIVHDRLYCSPRALRIAGVESELATRPRAEWLAMMQLHPEDAPRYAEDLRTTLQGPPKVRESEYRLRQSDGHYRWVQMRGICLQNEAGQPVRWGGSISDIDARKRAEQALRESEQRYQLAVAGSNQGLWDWDLATDTVFFSARAQELVGDVPGEPTRPRREWTARWDCHPDDLPGVRRALSTYLHGADKLWEVEYRLRHRNGHWHWYRDRGVALRDAAGRPYRMAGSLEDITERKHAQAAREQLEVQLRQAQKLEAIGTLAGGIAHDFNNILAAILGYGEMAQHDAAEGTPLRRHIDAALSAAMRAKSLVERILAFSRSGMGERVPVHVQSVVNEALEQITASLPAGIALQRELAAGDAAVLGDPTQVHQVVLNLCANAVQAMPHGGTLTVAVHNIVLHEPQVVTTSRIEAGAYLRLVVGDSGVGIAPRVLERIFDPFFTTKEIGVGTGLGLSLVHGIVTDLGGGISVQSTLGSGTTLTVYLPWSSCVAPVAAVAPPLAHGAGETVLLVDDEDALVQLGEEMLAQLGYEPVGFASSAAALESLHATPARFDVVLTDEAMPEMTGQCCDPEVSIHETASSSAMRRCKSAP